jgi:sterol 3beta-glucosyltransferase
VGQEGIQPYIALGKALQIQGHEVLMSCPENFAAWIEGHGLAFRSIGVDMQTFLQQPEGRKVLSGNPVTLIKIWKKTIVPLMSESLDAAWKSAHDADVIVYHPKVACAVDIAEATGAALVSTAPFPIFPTKAFPFLIFKGNFGPWLNQISYKPLAFSRLFFLRMINQWRKGKLGIGKSPIFMPIDGFKGSPFIQLCMASPALVPYPNNPKENIQTTGFWFLEEGTDWQPDNALTEFLKAGDKPIYIGFGSMPSWDPKKLTRQIIKAVRRANVRAILATGWGGISEMEIPDTIFAIEGAPHDALFKHVSAVVHHGGAGTTAAGLRAGLPTLICYSTFDQPYWGRRIGSLRCGPKPQSLKRIKATRFALALTDLTQQESYRERAGEIARKIAKEDGISRALELI